MTAIMAWVALAVAGLLDVAWAIAMKQSQGYTRLGWTLVSSRITPTRSWPVACPICRTPPG